MAFSGLCERVSSPNLRFTAEKMPSVPTQRFPYFFFLVFEVVHVLIFQRRKCIEFLMLSPKYMSLIANIVKILDTWLSYAQLVQVNSMSSPCMKCGFAIVKQFIFVRRLFQWMFG